MASLSLARLLLRLNSCEKPSWAFLRPIGKCEQRSIKTGSTDPRTRQNSLNGCGSTPCTPGERQNRCHMGQHGGIGYLGYHPWPNEGVCKLDPKCPSYWVRGGGLTSNGTTSLLHPLRSLPKANLPIGEVRPRTHKGIKGPI